VYFALLCVHLGKDDLAVPENSVEKMSEETRHSQVVAAERCICIECKKTAVHIEHHTMSKQARNFSRRQKRLVIWLVISGKLKFALQVDFVVVKRLMNHNHRKPACGFTCQTLCGVLGEFRRRD
jgi:chemotaxis protein histidine kinase CheA